MNASRIPQKTLERYLENLLSETSLFIVVSMPATVDNAGKGCLQTSVIMFVGITMKSFLQQEEVCVTEGNTVYCQYKHLL